MGRKKGRYISIAILVVLIVMIPILLYTYFGQGRKQIVEADKFIKKLQNENIIEKNDSNIKFKLEEKTGAEKNKEIYSLISDNYRVDLDKNFNVISFADNIKLSKIININLKEAQDNAKVYLSKICTGDYRIKETNTNNNDIKEDSPFYSVIFSKYEDGYPYYSEEVIMNINKSNGKLQGYVNKTKDDNHKKIDINVSKDEAEKKALKAFNDTNKDGKISSSTYLAFASGREEGKKLELCYVISVSNNKESNVYFIGSSSGNIINTFSNIVEKTKVK
ncbi:hypothetical protein [Clostridium sardiniense]|uniref:hypothetical protein n=1 Tax=Clostridium sardiniense TaxID=29369 RepID=UPI00195AA122|nr:hypothetical protein [Clostridium sardiniense]MBM7833731.1 hypothetical protein [Clostridium sardiniense]